jgi:hypothetical protein
MAPDAKAWITPAQEDFPEGQVPHGISPAARRSLGELRALGPAVRLVNAEGGGIKGGPSMGGVNVPGLQWHSFIRYIVYNTPEDARANASGEDHWRAVGGVTGSFSGAHIGDRCEHISSPTGGLFELHFVRANVSVNIRAQVPDAKGADVLQPSIEKALEATAQAIIKRINGVVAAKGKVDMTNLPPVRPRTGPMNATDPNRPPGAK